MQVPQMMSIEELRRKRKEAGGAEAERSRTSIQRADAALRAADDYHRTVAEKLKEKSASFRLQAVSGVFRGATFPIDGREVVIGRGNDGCHIRYPADTKGISRIHCSLRVENAYVILRDLGSSQGTFFEDGTKLKPRMDYRIRNDECFFLASTKERFRVEFV